ncbi:hypothetical protein E4T56_gene8025 [Termitomyces sp. T112]|nr:hypothetical protein E4T56_gene8025 [Termitomyces sp. T112]
MGVGYDPRAGHGGILMGSVGGTGCSEDVVIPQDRYLKSRPPQALGYQSRMLCLPKPNRSEVGSGMKQELQTYSAVL